jgi:predicted RNase H-like HicB family nuclease
VPIQVAALAASVAYPRVTCTAGLYERLLLVVLRDRKRGTVAATVSVTQRLTRDKDTYTGLDWRCGFSLWDATDCANWHPKNDVNTYLERWKALAGPLPPNANHLRVATLNYRVILEPDGSAYNVIVPAFPHVHTFGADVEEAMKNAREAIELELQCAHELGDTAPPCDAEHVVIGTVTVTPAS